MSNFDKSNEITNFYEKIPKKYLKQAHNPHYEDHLIKIPFRILIVGASGSGKTQLVLELLKRMRDTFEKVVLVVKNADEPLYRWLRDMLDEDDLEIYEGGEDNIPNIDLLAGKQTLIVFDDLCLDKNQKQIEQAFIRGRKLGLSMCYLTQSYFKTPKIIRLNVSYLFIKKLSSKRDLNLLLSEYDLGVDKQEMLELYQYAISGGKGNFLVIDCDADLSKRFRKNLLLILPT